MRTWIANKIASLIGWQLTGSLPDVSKAVIIAAPHTSNWDFVFLLLLANKHQVRLQWMGKEELFRGPMGPISRALGGIPVKRSRSMNMVAQMAQAFAQRPSLFLVIPPEATRRKTEYWKSGFYHIARSAGVPVVMGFVDYERKQAGFGPSFIPTGNIRQDMDRIRAFYANTNGKYRNDKGRIRLRQEDEAIRNEA